jgi:MFS transporter, AAHS family, 4-hydroxybenzoate transporter
MHMNPGGTFDLESIIDRTSVSGLQVLVIMLCALVAMMDGFDTQSIAFVAPEIAASWHLAPALFGPVFGAGLFGGLVGAMIFGPVGDRFGRKPVLVLAVVVFAFASLVTPLIHSAPALIAIRLVTGLGLGGALPNFIALTSEYSPTRLRTTLVSVMFCGFPLGAALGGFAAAKLIPAFGWQSVFILGGVLPLFVLPVFVFVIPESIRFLALKGEHEKIGEVLQRMKCKLAWNGEVRRGAGKQHVPLSRLFAKDIALGTLLLWATLFLSLLLSYFLINWIPLIVRRAGMDIGSAVAAVAMLNVGAIIGCVGLGQLADKFGHARIIGCGFAFGAACIVLLGHIGQSSGMLLAVAFLVGLFSVGAQMCTVAFCAGYYETALRATGLGWSMGIGRVGAIAGPVLGGMLIGTGVALKLLFVIAGLISLGAALAVFLMGKLVLRVRASGFLKMPKPVA